MSLPVAIGICEDELRFDLTFLKAFAGQTVDLRVTPIRGGTLDGKAARLVTRQISAMQEVGLPVQAVVVHHDADKASFRHRVSQIESWFQSNRFARKGLSLVVCAPDPCLERWLCTIEGHRASIRGTRPSSGCRPWKQAWARGRGIPLDRVREAAEKARGVLQGQSDFDRFFQDWRSAGLEPL